MDGRGAWNRELGWGQMPHPDKLRAWLREDWGAMSVGSGVGGARTALLGTGVAYGDGWGQMGRREVLALRCLWDGQGKCSETIVLEGLVSVKHLGFTP